MAMQALQTTLDDETADQAWTTAGGFEQSVSREVWVLVRNLQHQVNDLDARVTAMEAT
jgi:hypothetical protein